MFGKVGKSHVMRRICLVEIRRKKVIFDWFLALNDILFAKMPMADFFRVVRCLVNFSLVTKRTKHVSKVREVIRKCEKICEDDLLTLLMTSHTQKVTSWFLDSNFWAKLQISWPGWSADRSIKILHTAVVVNVVTPPQKICGNFRVKKFVCVVLTTLSINRFFLIFSWIDY